MSAHLGLRDLLDVLVQEIADAFGLFEGRPWREIEAHNLFEQVQFPATQRLNDDPGLFARILRNSETNRRSLCHSHSLYLM